VLESAPSLRVNPMPPRITQKSHRPRASHRMMVGTQANGWLAQLRNERCRAPWFMKRSSRDKPLGSALPLESATSRSGQPNHPCENERAGCQSRHPHLSEGRGAVFFLDILFHRMSVIGIFRQQRTSQCAKPFNIDHRYLPGVWCWLGCGKPLPSRLFLPFLGSGF
jgi:hypothetical protein